MSTQSRATSSRPLSLEARIQNQYGELPDSERSLADVILDFPGELPAYSATELARLAGVSKAAASRLFKRLGFTSFEEARRMARDSKQWGSPLYLQEKLAGGDTISNELTAFLDDNVNALRHTFEHIDTADLEGALDCLARAEHVWLIGFRNSYFLAAYARWQFIQFRPDVRLLPRPGETLGEYVAEFGPNDLVFAVGIRRRVPELLRVMQAARDVGTPILYVTDPTASATRDLATWTILADVVGHRAFDIYSGPLAVVHLLGVMALQRAGKKGRQRLERIERQHERLTEFE